MSNNKKHDYEKKWYEAFAKALLESAFPDSYQDIVLSDKPDLLMKKRYGIEVTRAFYNNTAEIYRLFDRVEKQVIDENNKTQVDTIKRLKDLGAEILINSSGIIHGIMPFKSVVINEAQFVKALAKKVQKYSNYNGLDKIDLFIFAPDPEWFDEIIITDFLRKNVIIANMIRSLLNKS